MNPTDFDEQSMTKLCKCPQCSQHLVLLDELLDRAEGWVRCSNCEQVFLAMVCLIDTPELKAEQAWSQAPKKPQGATAFQEPQNPISIDEFLYQKTLRQQTHLPPPGPELGRSQGHSGASDLKHALNEVRSHKRKKGFGFWRVSLLCVVMVLPMWFTYRFRNELAALHSGLKEPLVKMCEILNCQIEWPRDLSALSIESSALEKEERPDKEGKSNVAGSSKRYKYLLSLRIRNSFSYPLALPKVKLLLLDEKDQVMYERTLELSLKEEPQVIKPGGLNQFLLPLNLEDAPSLVPNGYRIELE